MIWLLVTLAMAVAPHLGELPIWLTLLFYALIGLRGFIATRNRSLPPRWLLLPLALLVGAGVMIEYRTLLGRDAGIALLTAMTFTNCWKPVVCAMGWCWCFSVICW